MSYEYIGKFEVEYLNYIEKMEFIDYHDLKIPTEGMIFRPVTDEEGKVWIHMMCPLYNIPQGFYEDED